MADYTKEDLIRGLRAVGVERGATLFCHSNLGYFGVAQGAKSLADLCRLAYGAVQEALGPEGTLIVPTFSYSFGSDREQKKFDPHETPSACGAFSEYIRKLSGSVRTLDPMLSVAAIGGRALELGQSHRHECFGEDSIWRTFLDAGGVVCNFNLDAASTFVHFVERRLAVPYRRNRTFSGTLVRDGSEDPFEVVYFSRDVTDPSAAASFERFHALATAAGLARTENVGRGSVVSISAACTAALIEDTLPKEPFFLTIAGIDAAEAKP